VRDVPNLVVVREIVIEAARRSGLGQTLLRESKIKDDGSVVTTTDHLLQETISTALRERWPDILFMGEEMEHARQVRIVNAKEGTFWTLDPLDGTTNFSMGFPFYGVSLALVNAGEVVLGVVYDPVRDECFHAVSGQGAYLNDQRLRTNMIGTELHACVANVDLKRLVGQLAERLVRFPPYRSQRNLGACVLEWCWVAAGRIQLYLHGGQRMWDYAAGSLILREAGGMFSTLRGASLDCQLFTKRSVVAAVNEELYHEWFRWLCENDNRSLSNESTMSAEQTNA
jgi:myo-inositol-1(or 4)-monophosphatase